MSFFVFDVLVSVVEQDVHLEHQRAFTDTHGVVVFLEQCSTTLLVIQTYFVVPATHIDTNEKHALLVTFAHFVALMLFVLPCFALLSIV